MIFGFKKSAKRSLMTMILSLVFISMFYFNSATAAPVTIFDEYFEDGYIDGDWNQEIVEWDWWYGYEWYWGIYTQDWWGYGYPYSAYEGYYMAGFAAYYGASTRMYTREIDFGAYTKNAKLTFYHIQGDPWWDGENLKVLYRTSWDNEWKELESWTSPITEWTEHVIDLPDVNGTYQIAFQAQAFYSVGIYIDNIVVTAEPKTPDATVSALLSPTSPFSVGYHDVKVTIKNLEDEVMTSCYVYWSVNGMAQPHIIGPAPLVRTSQKILNLGNIISAILQTDPSMRLI